MKILKWRDEEGNTLLHIAISKNQTQASSFPSSKMKIQTIVKSVLTKIQLIKEQSQFGEKPYKLIIYIYIEYEF